MLTRTVLAGFLFAMALQPAIAQETPAANVGWYNGDCYLPVDSWANWYQSDTQYSRIWDVFIVPSAGWTVTGVFSNNSLYSAGLQVTQAYWSIRSGVSTGVSGILMASGISPTTAIRNPDGTYRIEVNGLHVALPAGTYWLTVSPVVPSLTAFMCGTSRANSIGVVQGTSGLGLNEWPPPLSFDPALVTGGHTFTGDYSMGVVVTPESIQPLPTPADLWRSDIASLTQQMSLMHSVPFPGISQADFSAKATNLYNRVPTITDSEIRTGLQALVASIEDPHTDVEWPYPQPFRSLPLTFYWYDDGMYITAAPAQYQNLLGGKVVSIGQTTIDDATQRLTPLVPHENPSWPKYQIPLNKLTNTDFLFGTGITPDTNGAALTVQTADGSLVTVNVAGVSQSQYPQLIPLLKGPLPLYLQHTDRHYWATVIDGGATVYFQYSSCTEDPKQASAAFFPQLNAMLAQQGVERLIVDMRFNTGGYTSILDPWINQIETSQFNHWSRLYVIVGRATFSAAMAASDRFYDETAAIFVGEPTGGKPRFQVRQGDFGLPYFSLRASYSNGVMSAKDADNTLTPVIRTGLTFQEYMNGVDPALNAILQIAPSRFMRPVRR